ncbi:MAG: porin family protein [Rickettsiales bacterium]|nr:porin family protein [Rickettsiales bacterium]
MCSEVKAQSKSNWYNKFYVKAGTGAFIPANKFKDKNGDEDPYVAKKPKNTAVYNIGIGYKITDNIRSDLNFGYRKLRYKAETTQNESLSQKIKTYSVFLNGYYDFNLHKIIKPYLTIGIGYGRNKSKDLIVHDNESGFDQIFSGTNTSNFIWDVGLGTRLVINNRFDLDISYKYVYLGTVKTKGVQTGEQPSSQKVKAHEIMGGIIINL